MASFGKIQPPPATAPAGTACKILESERPNRGPKVGAERLPRADLFTKEVTSAAGLVYPSANSQTPPCRRYSWHRPGQNRDYRSTDSGDRLGRNRYRREQQSPDTSDRLDTSAAHNLPPASCR